MSTQKRNKQVGELRSLVQLALGDGGAPATTVIVAGTPGPTAPVTQIAFGAGITASTAAGVATVTAPAAGTLIVGGTPGPSAPVNTLNVTGGGATLGTAAGVATLNIPLSGPTLVFRPGGVTSGNVYATWAPLVLAAKAIQGPKSVFVDLTGAPGDGNAHVPAGAWDLGPYVTFQGDPTISSLDTLGLVFDVGSSLVAAPLAFVDLDVTSNSATPIYASAVAAAQLYIYVRGESTLQSTAASMFKLTGVGAVLNMTLTDISAILGAGFAICDAPQVSVDALGASIIGPNSLNGSALAFINLEPSSSASKTQLGVPVVISGFPTQHLTSAHGGLAGTPTIVLGAAAGGAGSSFATVRVTDTAGSLTVIMGGVPITGVLLTVTYAVPFPAGATPSVVLSRADGNLIGSFNVTGMTNTGFQIAASVAGTAAAQYGFTYVAIP